MFIDVFIKLLECWIVHTIIALTYSSEYLLDPTTVHELNSTLVQNFIKIIAINFTSVVSINALPDCLDLILWIVLVLVLDLVDELLGLLESDEFGQMIMKP